LCTGVGGKIFLDILVSIYNTRKKDLADGHEIWKWLIIVKGNNKEIDGDDNNNINGYFSACRCGVRISF
jgi:hypothetical protein